jgi:hypothetical protein
MKSRNLGLFSLFTLLGYPGCGGNTDSGTAAFNGWLGEANHLRIVGTFQQKVFDVDLKGDAAKDVYCHRFYTPLPGQQPDAMGKYDTSQVYFAMKEVGGVVDIEGTPQEFTISYWRHDMPAGTDLQVVARTMGGTIPIGQTWSDINIFEPGKDVLSGIESAAATGTVSMKLNSGTPDANGIVVPRGGRTGEFISVNWGPGESLKVSATADCNVTLVLPWPGIWVKP